MREAAGAATALLALWNDVDPLREAEYNEWHAREHVPERLTVPGMVWALRYIRVEAGPTPRYLTLYGLRDTDVLDSAEYRRLLAEPSPASRAMRPALRNIARWVCRLELDQGIDLFERLDVRLAAQRRPVAEAPPETAMLVGTRIPDAANLPWLTGGQAQALQGLQIEALARHREKPVWDDAVFHARLPIG